MELTGNKDLDHRIIEFARLAPSDVAENRDRYLDEFSDDEVALLVRSMGNWEERSQNLTIAAYFALYGVPVVLGFLLYRVIRSIETVVLILVVTAVAGTIPLALKSDLFFRGPRLVICCGSCPEALWWLVKAIPEDRASLSTHWQKWGNTYLGSTMALLEKAMQSDWKPFQDELESMRALRALFEKSRYEPFEDKELVNSLVANLDQFIDRWHKESPTSLRRI